MKISTNLCEKCGNPNPNSDWSNFCPKCREDFHSNTEKERERHNKANKDFWAEKPE